MGDVIYTPLIEDMTWSYSRVSCFDDCRYRWFLKYIGHIDEEPQFYASYGSFMHKLLEKYYKKELSKDELRIEFLTKFSTEVQGERPPGNIVGNYISKGLNYLTNFTDFPYETVGVEKKIDFDIDGIPFTAIIDYIGKSDDGYVIIDNKSRELKPRSKNGKRRKSDDLIDEMLKQLYVYSAAIQQTYGEYPKKLCFNCFKNMVFIEEQFNKDIYDETIAWVKKNIEDIKKSESEDFYPNVEFFSCRYLCGVSDECCYWSDC